MVMKMSTVVFWIVTTYSMVGAYQRSSETLVSAYKTTRNHNSEDHNR
jgi:hypothetical protein